MDEPTPAPCEQWWARTGKNRQVCRKLFGPVDRRLVRSELEAELQGGLEAAARRWAFNFEAERPLPGDFQWEAVSSRDVPSFYRPVCGGQRRRRPLSPPGPREGGEERTPSAQQNPGPPHNRKRKQALITDFYALRRRLGPLGPESKS